jgi:uncharacterized integral membrane protein (TIGR00697 family)
MILTFPYLTLILLSLLISRVNSFQSVHLKPIFHSKQINLNQLHFPLKSTLEAEETISDALLTSKSSSKYDNQYELSPQQFIYVVLSSIFITCLIIADVIGVKLFEIPLPFEIFGHKTVEHTCGMLTFPITFLLGDIINEYYGPKAAKNTVYIGLAMSILVFAVMNIAQALPYLDKPFNVTQQSFDMIFGSAKLMYVASIFAYLIGSLSDIWLFGVIKKLTQGKLLWLRATGSTVISQILDSFVVSYIAFSLGKAVTGQTPATIEEVANIAATGYGLKFFLSFSLTPFIYVIKSILTEQYGLVPLPPEPTDSELVKDSSNDME